MTVQRFTSSVTREIELEGGWALIPGLDMTRQIAQGVARDAYIAAGSIALGWTDCPEKKPLKVLDFRSTPGTAFFLF